MPRGESLALYRPRFDCRKVDIRNIRGDIKNLGVGIAGDSTIGAVFGMARQDCHNHDAWEKNGVTSLKNAMRLLGQATSGRKQALVGRIRNAFAHPPQIEDWELPRPGSDQAGVIPPCPDLDESTDGNKKRFGEISEPILHEARRVYGYAGEYAANYLIIYDGGLEVEDYSADAKAVQAECAEIAASGRHVNPREAFRVSCPIPPNMKWIGPDDAAASLRDWAARPARLRPAMRY